MRLSIAEPVRTSRLVLRGVEAADAAALLAYRSLPAVCRYVPFEPMNAADIAERLGGRWSDREIVAEGDGVMLGIVRADTDELIGDVSLWLTSADHRCAEIGWLLHPAHGGRGLATEAAHGVLHLLFDRLGVHRVVARVDARNTPSLSLCDRLGMRREAVLLENEWFKGGWSDEVDHALLERDWAAQHARVEAGAGGAGGAVCGAGSAGAVGGAGGVGAAACRWPLVDT